MHATPIVLRNGRRIGPGSPCFLIAEVGMNHNGDIDLARLMIAAAAEAGADAVKFQMFQARHFVRHDAMVYGDDKDALPSRQIDMMEPLEFSLEEWADLKRHADTCGILFFATPLDAVSVAWIEELDTDLVKIASCDCNNVPLIRRIAGLGLPTILSTGMSTSSEIEAGIEAFEIAGGADLCLMQCVSAYPASLDDANIRTIPSLAERFGRPVGFSDHCKENAAALGSVALGAVAIEKHFTTDNDLPGVDQKMSLNPAEFGDLVTTVRQIERALGDSRKRVLVSEMAARQGARRSLCAARAISEGEVATADMFVAKRPSSGLPPSEADRLVGRIFAQDVAADEPIAWSHLTGTSQNGQRDA